MLNFITFLLLPFSMLTSASSSCMNSSMSIFSELVPFSNSRFNLSADALIGIPVQWKANGNKQCLPRTKYSNITWSTRYWGICFDYLIISNTFWLPNTYLRKRKLTTLITDCKFTLSADNFLGFIILVLIYFWNGKSMSKMKSSIHVWKRKSCHIFNPVAKISGKLENCKATMQTKITHFVERWLQRLSIHSKFFEFPPPSSKVHWLFYALFGSLLSFVLIKL